MSGAPAPDRGAIAFAEKLMTVLAYGRKTATYKYAVLLGLIDLCHEQSSAVGNAPRQVGTVQLAEKVIELYWPQTAPYEPAAGARLSQNSGGRQAEILQLIRRFREEEVRDASASRTRSRLRCQEGYTRLVREVEWKLAEMPLPKLQRVGDALDPFVYQIAWDDGIRKAEYFAGGVDRSIHFVGAAADHLVRLAALLRPVIQREWARLVEQFNRELIPEGRLEDFLFGVGRISTAAIQKGLRELQDGRCFYCGDRFRSRCEVDHFVPWARYPDNGIDNLIAADRGCNGAKRDHLAAAEHVDVWMRRNQRHKSDLTEIAARAQWEQHPARSLAVARSIYLRLPDEARLWKIERDFVPPDRPRLIRAFAGGPGRS